MLSNHKKKLQKGRDFFMIYMFRKEIRKWYPILWIVFVSLAVSGIYGVFFSSPGNEVAVGKVNGSKVFFSQYRRSLSDIYSRIESVKNYARQYGISSEIFIAGMLGGRSPEQLAQEQCVHDALIDQIEKSVSPQLDQQWFKDELVKMFPPGVINEQGALNMDVYQGYLKRLGITPAQFEEEKEESLKRNLILNFVKTFEYTPEHELRSVFEEKKGQKNFSILVFNVNDFIKKARSESVDQKEIELFYQRHKESYRIPERRKVTYWMIDSKAYGKSVEIDEETILRFYERNKSEMFRIPPTVKVKRIFLKATQENRTKVFDQAKEILAQLKKDPTEFDAILQKKSDLKDRADLTISGRGEHESDLEQAAFRLKEIGDLSPVVRTTKGYEILKLVHRIPAAEKPLDVVKDEIVKTLKARRSLSKLKSDLETLVRTAKTDESVLAEFVQSNRLDEQETGWISSQDVSEKTVEAELAKRIFGKNRTTYGFIPYEENFVFFQVSATQASEVPPFNDVKNEVTDAFYNERGQDLLKASLRQAKSELLNKTATPEELAEKLDAQLVQTGLVSLGTNKGTDINKLKHIAGLKQRLFVLTDPAQVLNYTHKDEYLIVQLSEVVPSQDESFEQERAKIIKKEKMKSSSHISDAFIASLYRNAKIEFDEQLLGINRYKAKDV